MYLFIDSNTDLEMRKMPKKDNIDRRKGLNPTQTHMLVTLVSRTVGLRNKTLTVAQADIAGWVGLCRSNGIPDSYIDGCVLKMDEFTECYVKGKVFKP